MSPYLLAGPAVALIGVVAVMFVMRHKSTEKRSMYSSRRSQIEHKVKAARSRTLAPHGRSGRAPTSAEDAAADEPAPKGKGKKKDKQATATGAAWQLASGDSPSEEGSADEVKAPNPAMAIAQYAVLVVGLVMVLIGVLVMVANSKVT